VRRCTLAGGFSIDGTVSEHTETPGSDAPSQRHLVQFYEDEPVLLDQVEAFAADGWNAGDAVVVIATEARVLALKRRLEARGIDVSGGMDGGRLVFLDAHETLAKLMKGEEPDPASFQAEVARVIIHGARPVGSGKVRAFGEMVNLLWEGGQRRAAIRLEELWNELQSRHPFTLLCAYAMANFFKQPTALQHVCATHTHVLEDEGTTSVDTALPPQYARRLAREIAHREEMERALRDCLQELRARDEELRDFVENATIGLHRVAEDGTILWANRAELDMLGYDREEYVGHNIVEFHVDRPVIDSVLDRLRARETVHEVEARMRAKDGTTRHVLVSSSVHERDGKFVHTRCFTRDVTERKRVEEARRLSEEHLRVVADALPVLVSYIDDQERYQFVSAAYGRWFGRDGSSIVGKHLSDVLGQGYERAQPYVRLALQGETVTYEADLTYADGQTRAVQATYVPQPSSSGRSGFVALVSDITERRKLERFRALAAERAERLLRITAAIADAVSSEQVYEALVDTLYDALGATSAALWLVDEGSGLAKLVRQKGYSERVARELASLPLDSVPAIPAVDAIRRVEPIFLASQAELLERYPHLRSAATPGSSYRVSCLPLIVHGQVLGSLGLTTDPARGSSEDERSLLVLAARYASQAVERLRLFELESRSRAEANQAAQRMGMLSHASRVFAEMDLELYARLRGVVVQLGTTLRGSAGISLLNAEQSLQTCAVYHPVPEAELLLRELSATERVRWGEGLSGTVAANGESVLIPAIDPEALYARTAPAYRRFLEAYPVPAIMCAPLRSRGKVIGTVIVSRTKAGETYTPADLELLEDLAARAAGSIENSRLYTETLEARRRAEQLYHFAQAVAVADQVSVVHEAALGAIEGALGSDRAAILLLDEQKCMRFVAWRNLSDKYRSLVEGHSPWPPDATAAEPVLVPDAQNDAGLGAYAALFREERIGALAFIPLVTHGRLLGKFMLYYEEPHSFASHEIETAVAIANHLASVIVRFSAVARLEDTLRANELFAGVLAHDLQNPLHAIMTAAQVVLMRHEGERASDPSAKPLSKILSSGKRMARMIEQLLDFTRARTGGGIRVQTREAHAGELCAQAVEELELAHPEWTIEREVAGDLGVRWDPDRMLQVVSNLVANAGQHGAPGAPVRVRVDGSSSYEVAIEVRNEGAISTSSLPELFNPFRTSRQEGARSRGLGLGLFIVREIVHAHGGTVFVDSSEAAGTTFRVRVPRAVPPPD
jgi:PAS domain S-box-containing protein